MKEFDEGAAMSGARVCTKQGYPARILCNDIKGDWRPIVAVVEGKLGRETIFYYDRSGKNMPNEDMGIDLMMADDDYLEKLAREEYAAPEDRFIAPYLPYRLFCGQVQDDGRILVVSRGMSCNLVKCSFDKYLPILRPMSQLTQEISERRYNGGKPFIPIVEIAKTQYSTDEWRVTNHGSATTGSFTVSWEGEDLGFQVEDKYEGSQIVRYPHRLYDLLHQWHFDYRGMIEQGKALSAADGDIDLYSEM